MAQGSVTEPKYVGQLKKALEDEFPQSEIDYEPIRKERFRFVVVDATFDDMGHPERQEMVWAIAEKVLAKSDLMKVGMIITMSPAELPSN